MNGDHRNALSHCQASPRAGSDAMYETLEDTIVAISSAAGHAPRGIVRLSGPDALAIASRLFHSTAGPPLHEQVGFRRIIGTVHAGQTAPVPGEVYLFRAPHSYTRQDCAEIHTIGSPPLLAMVVNAAIDAGARPAQPGEFTARAFLAGAMDLSRAQAVAATINARTDAQLRAARKLQDGHLSRQVADWQRQLAELTALVEADIDFAEEPIEFIAPDALRTRVQALMDDIKNLCAAATGIERFDVSPTILLLGPPNAGKSSLLNALSGLDRAICSAIAGTTRDILTAPIRVGNAEALLLDAAGVHDDGDTLLREAQTKALRTAQRVDLLCLVVDLTATPSPALFDALPAAPTTPYILVANKADRVDAGHADATLQSLESLAPVRPAAAFAVSAVRGDGLDRLRAALADQLSTRDDLAEDTDVVLSARQRAALDTAAAALDRAMHEADGIGATVDRAEILAFELRVALDALKPLVGEVTTEDLLTSIFASFCIGK